MNESCTKNQHTAPPAAVNRRTFLQTTASLLAACPSLSAQLGSPSAPGGAARLAEGFRTPPDAAKPWVFWLLSRYENTDGITKVLEALKTLGVSGLCFGDGGPGQLSRSWTDGFRYLVREAARLGFDFNANVANGFGTGGT